MRIIHGQLLHLAGAAFEGDPFVSSGLAHLRWMMDHRLGFPRVPFLLERRASVRTPQGRLGLPLRTMLPARMTPTQQPGVLRGTQGRMTPPARSGDPWVFDFASVWGRRSTSVCWVEVSFKRGGSRRLRAVRDDRGQVIVLEEVTTTAASGRKAQLSGTQIDQLEIWSAERPTRLVLITLADLDAAAWANPMQAGIATEVHGQLFAPYPRSAQQMVDQSIGGFPGPLLEHPLDAPPGPDPVAGPAASVANLEARYRRPWFDHFEPLIGKLLHRSSLPPVPGGPGRLHQIELMDRASITEFTTTGAGVADGAHAAAGPVEVGVYASLMAAAASDFHLAKLLGLAAVPEESVQAAPGVWDYRLTGEWAVDDLLAYQGALNRRMIALRAEVAVGSITPEATHRQARSMAALDVELRLTSDLIGRWTNRLREPLTVAAFALGIAARKHPMPAPPGGLAVDARSPEVPGRIVGTARLAWDARQRAGASDQAQGSYSAIVWRTDATGGSVWLHEPSALPGFGGLRLARLTQDAAPGFTERALPLNTDVRYSVAESDAWGRWSAYAEIDTHVAHRVPPPPVGCQASLLPSATITDAHRLRIRFRWDVNAQWDGGRVLGDPAVMSFALHLRSGEPPAGRESDPAHWSGFAVQPGRSAPALIVRGNAGAGSIGHDGATVTIAAPLDATDPPPAPSTLFRHYDLVVDPVHLPDAGGGLRRAWVAVRTRHNLEGEGPTMGQWARVEHLSSLPPSNPAFPPGPILATWADADGRSTAVLAWTQPATPVPANWAQVLAAGETEVVAAAREVPASRLDAAQASLRMQALAAVDDAAGSLTARVTALRQLATLTPEVFAIETAQVALVSGLNRLIVELPGALLPLRLYVVRPMTAQGVGAQWPNSEHAIAAVKVPHAVFPVRPVVVRAERARGHVMVRVQAPPPRTAAVGQYELYRSADGAAAAAGDHRRMRLVGTATVTPGSWTPWVWFDDDFAWVTDAAGATVRQPRTRETLVLTDAQPPAAQAYYCVVARANGPAGNQGRSPPSVPVPV